MDLHELVPVGGRPASGRERRRFKRFATVGEDLPDRAWLRDERDQPDISAARPALERKLFPHPRRTRSASRSTNSKGESSTVLPGEHVGGGSGVEKAREPEPAAHAAPYPLGERGQVDLSDWSGRQKRRRGIAGLFDDLFGMAGNAAPVARLAGVGSASGSSFAREALVQAALLARMAGVPGLEGLAAEAEALVQVSSGRPLMMLPMRVRVR